MIKLTVLEQIQKLALYSKSYSAEKTAELATRITEAIEELSAAINPPASVSFTIPAEGWTFDQAQPYSYYYDIVVNGVSVNDRAEITLSPDSAATASACGLCPTNETLANKIRIRAISVPNANMTAEYWIEKGQEKE